MHLPLFAYFTPGPLEILVIGVVILLLFGSRLPSVMRSLGRSVVEFKKGVNAVDEPDETPADPPPTETGR